MPSLLYVTIETGEQTMVASWPNMFTLYIIMHITAPRHGAGKCLFLSLPVGSVTEHGNFGHYLGRELCLHAIAKFLVTL